MDAADPQAVEQLRLTIDFLEFLRTRIYDIHARQRYELGRQLDLARALLDDAALITANIDEHLEGAWSRANAVYIDASAHTEDLRAASQHLWAAVRGVIRTARHAPEEIRNYIGAQIISGMEPLVEVDSAWYLPFGSEPEPARVPGLDDLLGRASTGMR
ncbi:hypothetical protein [Nocardia vaccinii]|uniref:hypothetical protein n=1 Tax=Nocardia vaccinii TaxID=1822 RepID=UPI0012F47889|nr:hypothetical protein [Nocardia vaccinii]